MTTLPRAGRPEPTAPPVCFGPGGRFELRAAEYRLLVDGEPVPLGGRALDLLFALAARPGQMLTKNELLDQVWPGLVVEESNLRVQVNGLRRLLGEDIIATVPGRGYRFAAAVQAVPVAVTAEPAASVPAPAGPLPAALPRLYGRDADLARIEQALRDPQGGRCVTLVGLSGVGKSSLARRVLSRHAGPGVWIDLAAESDAAQLAGALARGLGLQPAAGEIAPQLPRALSRPECDGMLVVLDNAEHLVGACAELLPPLLSMASVQWLVTSQRPLAVRGERILRIEPLPLPDAAGATDDDALALLVDRITAADLRFTVTPASRPLLVAICHQLDGLPLALEMAAARVPTLGLKAVHDALADRLALLTRGRRDAPDRHRSLRAALEWSYRLLDPEEQRLFRALAVFAGGFTLDLAVSLAEREGTGRWDVIDNLAALAERSLVAVGDGDPPRYRLLETVRAFALDALTGSPEEAAAVRRRHALAVLVPFERRDDDALALAEIENAREAWAWARRYDFGIAARLTAFVPKVTAFSVWRQETTDWALALEPAMRGPEGLALPQRLQAEWWVTLSYVLNMRGDAAAAAAARQAVALFRLLHEPYRLLFATAQWVRGAAIRGRGAELDQACAELQAQASVSPLPARQRLHVQGALATAAEARGDRQSMLECRLAEAALARELGWSDMAHTAESNVCNVLNLLGRHAEAAERGRVLLADLAGAEGNEPWTVNGLLVALTALGASDEAQALVPRAIAACRRYGTRVVWPNLVALATAQQRHPAAAVLAGHLRQRAESHGEPLSSGDEQLLARAVEAATGALGRAAVEQLLARGRGLDDEAAAAWACAQADAD